VERRENFMVYEPGVAILREERGKKPRSLQKLPSWPQGRKKNEPQEGANPEVGEKVPVQKRLMWGKGKCSRGRRAIKENQLVKYMGSSAC